MDAALGAINKALELNPANVDAIAVSGLLLDQMASCGRWRRR